MVLGLLLVQPNGFLEPIDCFARATLRFVDATHAIDRSGVSRIMIHLHPRGGAGLLELASAKRALRIAGALRPQRLRGEDEQTRTSEDSSRVDHHSSSVYFRCGRASNGDGSLAFALFDRASPTMVCVRVAPVPALGWAGQAALAITAATTHS